MKSFLQNNLFYNLPRFYEQFRKQQFRVITSDATLKLVHINTSNVPARRRCRWSVSWKEINLQRILNLFNLVGDNTLACTFSLHLVDHESLRWEWHVRSSGQRVTSVSANCSIGVLIVSNRTTIRTRHVTSARMHSHKCAKDLAYEKRATHLFTAMHGNASVITTTPSTAALSTVTPHLRDPPSSDGGVLF